MSDSFTDTVSSTEESPSPAPRRSRKRSVFDDPLVRTLSLVLLVVVILFLATIAAALFLGILGSDTPRTAQERDLQAYAYQTSQGTTDAEVWKSYVSALVDSGQLSKAQQVIDEGLQVIDNEPGAQLTFAQVQVYFSGGDYEDAVATATEGMDALSAYHERRKNETDTPESKGEPINDNYWGMLYLRARSYDEMGEQDKALADYDTYLEEKGGASDVLVLRGDLKAEMGDTAGAEEDYRTAIKFYPDYQPALDALEKLGAE